MLDGIADQSLRPEQVLIGWTGEEDHDVGVIIRKRVALAARIRAFPPMNDYGYGMRNALLPDVRNEWVSFWCHDDSYHPRYLELMLAASQDKDVVYCNWNVWRDCKFRQRMSTLGNFIIRTELLREAGGFWRKQMNNWGYADAALIDWLNEKRARIAHVPHILYYHNVPYSSEVKPCAWGIPTANTPTDYATWCRETDRRLSALRTEAAPSGEPDA